MEKYVSSAKGQVGKGQGEEVQEHHGAHELQLGLEGLSST